MKNPIIDRILKQLGSSSPEERREEIIESRKKAEREGNKRRNKKWKENNKEHVAELDRIKAKKSYHKNHEENKRRQREFKKKLWDAMSPEERQDFNLRRTYGVSLQEKNEMLERQGGVCAICGTGIPGSRGWQLDHCHNKKHVRGILCHGCNTGLGLFKDSPEALRKAIEYLERFQDVPIK